MKVKLSQVKVDPDYSQVYTIREIENLVESMEMNELLKPLMVTNGLSIINGLERFLVANFLGWDEIEVTIKPEAQEQTTYTDVPSNPPDRNKRSEVFNEIHRLYKDYPKPSENISDHPETNSSGDYVDSAKPTESWYW